MNRKALDKVKKIMIRMKSHKDFDDTMETVKVNDHLSLEVNCTRMFGDDDEDVIQEFDMNGNYIQSYDNEAKGEVAYFKVVAIVNDVDEDAVTINPLDDPTEDIKYLLKCYE